MKDKFSLYREKEVQNLADMIYKEIDKDEQDNNGLDSEYVVDTNRF